MALQALKQKFEDTRAPKVLRGQFCEVDYWNGTVLNVAQNMIPVVMELMHVRLQRP
jgi:hypothetical protein